MTVASLLLSLLATLLLALIGSGSPRGVAVPGAGTPPTGAPYNLSDPRRPLPAGLGALTGIVEIRCSDNPNSGCQNVGAVNRFIRVRTLQGASDLQISTAADGSFWVEVTPGPYLIEDESPRDVARAAVSAGAVTVVTLIVRR